MLFPYTDIALACSNLRASKQACMNVTHNARTRTHLTFCEVFSRSKKLSLHAESAHFHVDHCGHRLRQLLLRPIRWNVQSTSICIAPTSGHMHTQHTTRSFLLSRAIPTPPANQLKHVCAIGYMAWSRDTDFRQK